MRVSVKAGIFSVDKLRLVSMSGDVKSYFFFFPRITVVFNLKMRHHGDFMAAQGVAPK